MRTQPVYTHNPTTLWRRAGEEVLLTTHEGPEIRSLSKPAAAAWLATARPKTRPELTEILADVFGASPEEIAARVERVIDELDAGGWLIATSSDG